MQLATTEKRDKFQAYYTPAWMVFELLNYYKNNFYPDIFETYFRMRWLEPCSGDLAIPKSVAYWCGKNNFQVPSMLSNDIDTDKNAYFHFDATKQKLYDESKAFLTVSNPPYGKLCGPIVERAIKNSHVVWMLLRISFTEMSKERQFLKEFPPDKIIALPRYSFSKSKKHPDKWGVDPLTVAWFIWDGNIRDNRTLSLDSKDIEYFYKNPDEGIKKFNHLFV